MSINIKETITNTILERMEQGEIPWKKSWSTVQMSTKGKPYQWINQLLLQIIKLQKWFTSNQRITFKQCSDMWGRVNKGEKSCMIVFRDVIEKPDQDNFGKTKKIPFLRYHNVFNLDQTTIAVEPPVSLVEAEKYTNARQIIANFEWPQIGVWPQPLYRPIADVVEVPNETDFTSPEEYFVTLYHELWHSTWHHTRLDRKEGMEKIMFGSDPYAKEELIAEMCAAFLSAHAGIEQPILDNTTAYIQGRSKRFKENPHFLMSASNQGRKASEFILGQKGDLIEVLV